MTEEPAPAPATSRTEVKVLRLHVSGLPGKITEKDLEERFRSFGKVLKVDLIPHPFEGISFVVSIFQFSNHFL